MSFRHRVRGRLEGLADLLPELYGVVAKTRILEIPLMERGFVGSYFLYKRFFEDPFYGLVDRHPELFRGGNVIDVGANVGYTASLFASVMTEGFRVYAFEPEELNYQRLCRFVARKRLSSCVEPIPKAVGAASGEALLFANPRHSGDHRIIDGAPSPEEAAAVQRVPIVSLDDFAAERPELTPIAFIKVDVQGHELEIYEGMKSLIERCPKATLSFEYSDAEAELEEKSDTLVRRLREDGYTCYVLGKDGSLSASSSKIETDRRRYLDLVFSRDPIG